MYMKCQDFALFNLLVVQYWLDPYLRLKTKQINGYPSIHVMYKKCKAELITVNQTWLKLAENSESSMTVNWVVLTVLNKLQKW